jgi:hypothetical protein
MANTAIICPICRSAAKPLERVGDVDGFDCSNHGKFFVAGSIFQNDPTKNASREQWEAALTRAKARAAPGEWPCMRTHNF